MSFLKEIIIKLEAIPGSERVIERIMALVDGDIEKDIDVTVMQEITKIIEEETGISAYNNDEEEQSSAGVVAIDENDPNPQLTVGLSSVEDAASTEIPISIIMPDADINPEEFSDVAVSAEEDSDTTFEEWGGWDFPGDTNDSAEDDAKNTSSDEGSECDATEGDATEPFQGEESSAEEQIEADEETAAEASLGNDLPMPFGEPAQDEEDILYKQAIRLIKKMLDDKEYSYSETKRAEDVYIIKFPVRYDYCRLYAEIYIEKDPLICFVRISLPIACDPVYFPVLGEHLAALNRKSSRYGAYALDLKDGSVECRFKLRYDDGLGIKAFQKMLFFSLGDADDEYPEISRLSVGKLKRDKREETVKKAKALIADIEDS